jgi:phage shock protein PspC (stress-responsive transcriptional regulator)
LLIISICFWGLFQARFSRVSTHGEIVGVVALLIAFFSLYLTAGNLFILVFILETQGLLLLYFIALLQMTGRSTTLGRW